MNFLPRILRSAGYFLIAIFALFSLALLIVSPGLTHASAPPPLLANSNGKIAFTSEYFLYTVNPDGSAPTEIVSDGTNQSPAWSPDGSKIAFGRRSAQDTTYVNADMVKSFLISSEYRQRF